MIVHPPRENTRSEFHTRVFRESAGIFTSRHVCNKLVVSSLLRIDFHKLATARYQQTCAKLLTSLLQTCCEQPCYSIVTTTSLQVRQQVATSLFQQAGNKQCEHILLTSCWNSIATSLLQACYNLCVFTRVVQKHMNFSTPGACYMRGGTGSLPGRDVYRDGMFTGTGRLPARDVRRRAFILMNFLQTEQ